MKSCFLLGHRDVPKSVSSELYRAIERHVTEYGVNEFLVGHYGNFDRMAADVLFYAKHLYAHITLTLLLPYHPTESPWPLPDGFDGSYYPPGMENVPRRYAIIRANRYAIQNSDYLICYDRGLVGSTREFVAYARRLEKKGLITIENIAQ